MRVLFCTSDKIGASAIRAVTWSDWSHVALLLDDGTVIEAVWPSVRRVPLQEVLDKHPRWAIVEFPDVGGYEARALSQIGKPYDLAGMLGLGINRDWQSDDKWWCSEFLAWLAERFRDATLHRVTPQHLWMLNFPVLETSP